MVECVNIEKQLGDIFTKPHCNECFSMIRKEIGMVDINEIVWFDVMHNSYLSHFYFVVVNFVIIIISLFFYFYLFLFIFLCIVVYFNDFFKTWFLCHNYFLTLNLVITFIFIHSIMFLNIGFLSLPKWNSELSTIWRIGSFENVANLIIKCT